MKMTKHEKWVRDNVGVGYRLSTTTKVGGNKFLGSWVEEPVSVFYYDKPGEITRVVIKDGDNMMVMAGNRFAALISIGAAEAR
jgi:hypothetical protein